MIVVTIPHCLAENQLPNQNTGVRGPPSSPWQSLWTLVVCTHLVVPLSYTADSAVPRNDSEDGGRACVVVADTSVSDHGLSECMYAVAGMGLATGKGPP